MSFVSADCLENVIGLSESTCECFDTPSYANLSLSGLFLDKLEGLDLNMANAAANCEHGSLWDVLSQARRSAIIQFRTFLFLGLTKEYKKKHEAFKGAIGESKFRTNLALNDAYAGLSVFTNNIRGGMMKVNRIGAMFSQTGSFDLTVFNDYEYSSLETINIQAEANRLTWTTINTPLYLPMINDTGTHVRYDFMYDTASIPGPPKDTKTSCGCGGKKNYYNPENPQFNTASRNWDHFIMIAGASGSAVADTTSRDNLSRNYLHVNGIILDVEFQCDIQDLLCQSVTDFDNGNLSLSIATAIRYLAGAFVIDTILASGNISFYTMTDRERLMGKKNSYTKSYNDLVQEIITQFNISGNDCLMCKNNGPVKRGILA